jgi:hypothetical protein
MIDERKILMAILILDGKLQPECPCSVKGEDYVYGPHSSESSGVFFEDNTPSDFEYFSPCANHLQFYNDPFWRRVDPKI